MKKLRVSNRPVRFIGAVFLLLACVLLPVTVNAESGVVPFGSFLWATSIDGALRAGPFAGVDDGYIFMGTGQGRYYAIEREDGKLVWELPMASSTFSKGYSTGSLVVVASRGDKDQSTVIAVDSSLGTRIWHRKQLGSIDSPLHGYRGDLLVVGHAQVTRLRLIDGQVVRSFDLGVDGDTYFRNGILLEGVLFHEVRNLSRDTSTIMAWELEGDTLLWEHQLDHIGTHEIVGSKDYLAWTGVRLTPRTRVVVVADRRTGELLHERPAEHHVHGLALSDHGLIVVEGLSVSLWSHDLQTRVWEFETRFGAYTTPLVVGNTVLIGGYDEEGLMALDLRDGSLKARYPLELREVGGYWVSPERDLLVFGEADDNPAPGPRNVYALRVDPEFWD